MEKHFDYYRFYDMYLTIYCDENDEIIGYFTIRNGNEFGQIYVNPKLRGSEIVHVLIREALNLVHAWGFPCVYGTCYEKMKRFYERFRRVYGLNIEFAETPEERTDSQYKVILWFTEEKK